jgi:4-hydroxybenzoate polyprenyltransferase
VTAPATLTQRLLAVARDIKLSHSVFALPFALLATFLAAATEARRPTWDELLLIVVCMVLARTVAMTVNRWADARLDAVNPRTAGRAIPSGRLDRAFVLTVALACAAMFIVATSIFWVLHANIWPLLLSPLVLAWLAGYSFSKRFTWLCHLWLGVALALSPLAASVAITPASLGTAAPWLLAAMVACWVAGFDIIYALQDIEVDRTAGLHSMPSRLGSEPALWISRLLHLTTLAALVGLTLASPYLHVLFGVGVVVAAGLLVLEHALVWGSRTHHLNVAFLTVNGVISLLLGALGIADIVRLG